MRVPRIHTHQSLTSGGRLALEAGPSQHLARALRMGEGDELTLFDGTGGEYAATISEVTKKSVWVEIGDFRDTEVESPLAVELGIAVSRGERMDWVVQKATELGVTRISPLFSERTEVRLKGERAEKKRQHWQQIAISACEQSGRNRVPDVAALVPLNQWLSTVQASRRFVLHHRAEPDSADSAIPDSVALLIGPEGGLSAEEITAAGQANFEALQLGPRVLRTETAPLVALTLLQSRWGDLP